MAEHRGGNFTVFGLCVESSHLRGFGHLFRALNLADALVHKGHRIRFFTNSDCASLTILKNRGHIPEIVDLHDYQSNWETRAARGINVWINDRLDTDIRHSTRIKALGIPIVTFDDRGTGAFLSDINVAALIPDTDTPLGGCEVLTGVDYLILNPEILKWRRLRSQDGTILVTLGGSDTYGVTVRIVTLLAERQIPATIVTGPGFQHYKELKAVLTSGFTVKQGVPSLIKEMQHHSWAITGGGITPFEANASGLPCIVIANETFEIPVGKMLASLGGSVFAGHHSTLDLSVLLQELPLRKMSQLGMDRIHMEGLNNIVRKLEGLTTTQTHL